MPRVCFDTSFLMYAVRRKVSLDRVANLFDGPVEFCVSRGVVRQLKLISNSSRSDAKYAGLALKLINNSGFSVIPSTEDPDDWLLRQKLIATVDIKLARKARKLGIRVISITKSNKIVIS